MSAPTVIKQQSPNVHEMVVIHRAFRREFGLLPVLVRGVAAGDRVRSGLVAEHARFVLAGLHIHHTGEDALLWPKLLERATPSADLIHRMQAQHDRVAELIERLDPLLSRWAAVADASGGADLAATIDKLWEALVEHLDAEELEILPLAERHLSVAEWDALGEHAREAMPRKQLPLMFGAIFEDARPDERAVLLAALPAPVRLLLRTIGARQYRRYITAVRRTG